MQPTAGLGATDPSACRASISAAPIQRESSPVELALVPLNVELADEILEVLDLAEIAVDRGEAHIGDRIERVERVHHLLADLVRGDLGFAGALEPPHDGTNDALDALGIDRPLACRDLDRFGELVAIEGNPLAALLHHREIAKLNPLECREARSAGRAETPATDRRVVVRRARILHLRVVVTAEWAAHPALSPRSLGLSRLPVDREAPAECAHLFADACLHLFVAVLPVRR